MTQDVSKSPQWQTLPLADTSSLWCNEIGNNQYTLQVQNSCKDSWNNQTIQYEAPKLLHTCIVNGSKRFHMPQKISKLNCGEKCQTDAV